VTSWLKDADTIEIAGRRLRVFGDNAVAAVGPAFAGILDRSGGPVQATLEIETLTDPAGQDPWRDYAIGSHRSSDGALAVIRREPSSVETYVPGGVLGGVPRLHLAASTAALASGDLRSQPANRAIASWLASPTVQLAHAAAVALDGCGVLLVGVGGRGKSTTALACAQAGFSFLGDDLCVIEAGCPEHGTPARVHGVYATVKLNRDSQEHLGARDWPFLGVTPKGKSAFALPPAIRFERAVPLVAIVGVRADGQSADGQSAEAVRRMSAPAAMGLLAATGLPMATGSGTPGQWLSAAAAIAREIPAYELGLTWDLQHVVATVRAIVERNGPR
jgi:hypothetical protein